MSCTEFQQNPVDPFDLGLRAVFSRIVNGVKGTQLVRGAVGWSPWLALGSSWAGQEYLGTANTALERYTRRVWVGPETVRELTLSSPGLARGPDGRLIEIDSRIVPRNVHDFGPGTADIRLVAVAVGDDPFGLLIPAYSLIQFYICQSSELAQTVFGNGFLDERALLFEPSKSYWVDHAKGIYRLHLRRPLPNGDAAIVGRFAASPDGGVCRRMYQRVHSSLRKDWVNRQSLQPAFGFPFTGPTKLVALGRSFVVRTPLGPRRRFLALQILQCSAEFPFKVLEIESERANAEEKGTGENGVIVHRRAFMADGARLTVSQRPDPQVGSIAIPGQSLNDRFPSLRSVEVRHNCTLRPGTTNAIHRTADGLDAEIFATGPLSEDGSGVGRVRQVATLETPMSPNEPEETTREYLSAGGQTFSGIMAALNRLGCKAMPIVIGEHCVRVNGHDYGGMPNGRSWHLLQSGRRRALFAAELVHQGRHAYLFDIERDATDSGRSAMMVLSDHRSRPMTIRQLNDVLLIARQKYRLWNEDTRASVIPGAYKEGLVDLASCAIWHNGTTAEAYAEAAISFLEQIADGQTRRDETGSEAGSRAQRSIGGP